MIHYRVQSRIAHIVLDNPETLNALTLDDMQLLRETWERFGADDAARVAILSGAGDRAFCSGRDFREFGGGSKGLRASFWADPSRGAGCLPVDGRPLWKPVIAAIHGHCVGEGLVQTLGADFRIAASNSRFSMPEVKLGFTTVTGAALLPSIVGHSAAARLLLLGETIDAAEALRVGLVDEVCSHAQLAARAQELAETMAAYAPLAVQAIKEVMVRSRRAPLADVIALGEALRQVVLDSDDYAEVVRARAEDRAPTFEGR